MKGQIREFLKTGTVKKYEHLFKTTKTEVMKDLESVWGIGPAIAKKLYDKGIASIEDLREHQDLLTELQQIGLKYHEDFSEPIPKKEIEQIYEHILG